MYKAILILLLLFLSFAGSLPDSSKTPGDTVYPIMLMEICNKEFLAKQMVSEKTKEEVMKSYGIPNTLKKNYFFDQLIPVNLGGNSELKNVWPQQLNSTWSPYKKKQLEDTLNWLVCNAKMTLSDARYIIKRDWVSAYKYYVLKDTAISLWRKYEF
jgi:hypothetical protein